MKLDWAMLANHAEIQNGLAYINGGAIDSVNTPQLPATFVGSLVFRLTLHPTELDRPHQIEIQIRGEDGLEIAKLGGQTQVLQNQQGALPKGWDAGSLLSFALTGLRLPRFGFYSVEILIDGNHAKSIPFRVVQLQMNP